MFLAKISADVSSAKQVCTPSFVCELPLRVAPAQGRVLNARLEAARQVYNACLGKALVRARLLRERRAYRAARRQTAGEERSAAFRAVRRSVEFSDAALQRYAVRLRQQAFRDALDVHVAQKLASRAFAAANAWLLGKRGRPRFKGYRQLDTVEGKSNHAGIRWRGDHVEWFGVCLPAILDSRDPVIAHALSCRVKYVRLVRRKTRSRDRFSAQLVCEGAPYRKPRQRIGEGEVGLDIGPSTVAVVGEQGVWLAPFCEEVVRKRRLIRRLQRKLDRQRRANNPQNFLPDGRCFLFSIRSPDPRRDSIYVQALDSREARLVVRAALNMSYADSGHLLSVRDGALLGQRFDPDRAVVEGDPVPLAERVDYFSESGAASFSARGGVLAFRGSGRERIGRASCRERV